MELKIALLTLIINTCIVLIFSKKTTVSKSNRLWRAHNTICLLLVFNYLLFSSIAFHILALSLVLLTLTTCHKIKKTDEKIVIISDNNTTH